MKRPYIHFLIQGLFFMVGIYLIQLTVFFSALKIHSLSELDFLQENLHGNVHHSAILFREVIDNNESSYLPFVNDEVPGYDHIALAINDSVYEVHPGYGRGIYLSANHRDSIRITNISGLQSQHNPATFAYNSRINSSTRVKSFNSVRIPDSLAFSMLSAMQSLSEAHYKPLDFHYQNFDRVLSPKSQKGTNSSFTCSGIIEWAAEQAGHNNGSGFVPNHLESILLPNPFNFFILSEFPTLSPQLIFMCIARK